MKYLKIYYRLLVYFTSFTFVLEILRNKKSSENDQLTCLFQSFSPVPPTLNLKKNPVNQLIKFFLALCSFKKIYWKCTSINKLQAI